MVTSCVPIFRELSGALPHTGDVLDPNALVQGEPQGDGSLESPVIGAAVSAAVAVVAGITSDATSGLTRVAFGLVMVVAGLYALYTAGVLVIWFGLNRIIDDVDRPARSRHLRVVDRLPWFVWACVPLLVGGWALSAWLSGYDASEWLWSAGSVAVASVVVIAVYFRRR